MPALRHSSDGVSAAARQEAVVQGATRSERIDALTEHPVDGVEGSEAAQPVALISAVQTEDGRLVVDSVAAGASAQSGAVERRGAATLTTGARAGGLSAAQQQARGHAGDGPGSSTVDGAGSAAISSSLISGVEQPRRRGILQRLRLRPQSNAVSTDALPADVP